MYVYIHVTKQKSVHRHLQSSSAEFASRSRSLFCGNEIRLQLWEQDQHCHATRGTHCTLTSTTRWRQTAYIDDTSTDGWRQTAYIDDTRTDGWRQTVYIDDTRTDGWRQTAYIDDTRTDGWRQTTDGKVSSKHLSLGIAHAPHNNSCDR